MPTGFVWTSDDNSASKDAVVKLETEFGFHFIEAVGSLNYLANTAVQQLFAIQKACRFTQRPGRRHFEGLLHLLHHIRCHPPPGLTFYHEVDCSPLSHLLQEAKLADKLDMHFIYFSDSSWGDCDNQRSTGSYIGFFQGGVVDMNSFVPEPIALSSAEAESNALCVAAANAACTRMIVMEIMTGDSDCIYTVPFLLDNTAAEIMTRNNKDTKRTRHIARRMLFARYECQHGHILVHYVDGKQHQVANIGTKARRMQEIGSLLAVVQANNTR